MTLKTLGIVAGCVVAAFAAGWFVGAAGRAAVTRDLAQTEVNAGVADVRASVLEARLSVAQANYGDARRSIQRARAAAEGVETRLRALGRADRASGVQIALAHLADAERLSGALDADADRAAAEALRAIESSVPVVGP